MEPSFLHMRTPLGHNCRCNNLLYFPSLICPVFLVSNNIFEYTACQYTKMKAKTPYLHRDSSSTEFRQSLSVLSSEMIRNSLSIGSTSPSLYRESLGSCLKSRNSMPLEVLQYFRQEYEHERMEREKETFTSLKSTLNELQKKITHAKRHFASSKNLPQFDDTDDEVVERPAENEKTLSYSGELNTTLSSSGKIQINTKENNTNSQSKKNKGYYLNNLSAALEGNHPRALDHINFSIRVLKNYYIMTSPTFADIEQKRVYLPRSKSCLGKKTLILDIDQTLIHCEEDPCKPFDIAVPVEIQNGSKANAYITIRPYAISFLKRMSKHYEIIAFTASHESYADAVLDQIDPEKQYIKHRLYRKNCIEIYDKIFVKDLRVINRDLNSMVLVDNAPYSYMFQLQNGIPILPYYTGEDSELMHLQKYLQEMLKCQDVREFNKKHFQLHKYCTFDDSQGLIKELYL